MTSRRFPRWARVLVPAFLIVAWLGVASIGGPYFGRVDEVSSNDATAYLPSSAEATQVQQRLSEFTGSDAIPAVVVFVANRELSADDLAALQTNLADAESVAGVTSAVSPLIPSQDGRAAQAFIPLDSSLKISTVVDEVRSSLAQGLPEGISVYVTGPAGFAGDLVEAFAGIDGLLLGVALLAVFIILILVYRSALLPIVVLATSMFALCAALLTVWWLAKSGALLLSGQTQGIMFILVIGAATDYSLLYTARYRDELRVHADRLDATIAAWKGSVEPISASAGTVIAGLLCLLLSDLRSNSALGPVAAIGIVFALLASLTLLPALLYAFGRAAFWPRRPQFEARTAGGELQPSAGSLWARLARVVSRHPRAIWVTVTVILLAGSVGMLQLQANGVAQSDLVLSQSQAREGQAALEEHFAGGSGSPVYVIVPQQSLQDAADVMRENTGISSVAVASSDSPSGTLEVTEEGVQAPRSAESGDSAAGNPTVVDGDVLLQGTLSVAADSSTAESSVRQLRAQLADGALVGGVTATAIDTDDASIHDRSVIIPAALLVIMVILMLLLRSIVAPVLLVATTVVSFTAVMGVSALVFNHVFRFPGADPAVPLFGFVFLVALGVDYNIFLMTRVREESIVVGTRRGVLRGLALTGGVITSAGLVLAATFSALAIIPVLFLVQLAFIVAFGVLIDTFVVRTLLVPSLVYDVGRRVWWPSALARDRAETRESGEWPTLE